MALEKIKTDGSETGLTVANKVNAIIDAGSVGVDQTWQDMTSQRALDTEYTNDTGKPIMIIVSGKDGGDSWQRINFTVNGLTIERAYNTVGTNGNFGDTGYMIVPSGHTYSCSSSPNHGLRKWYELR